VLYFKAPPGGFGNHESRIIWHKTQNKPSYSLSLSEIKTPAPACFGNLAEKSGASGRPPAPFGDCFFYNRRVLPL
jgi:hypothetical protein